MAPKIVECGDPAEFTQVTFDDSTTTELSSGIHFQTNNWNYWYELLQGDYVLVVSTNDGDSKIYTTDDNGSPDSNLCVMTPSISCNSNDDMAVQIIILYDCVVQGNTFLNFIFLEDTAFSVTAEEGLLSGIGEGTTAFSKFLFIIFCGFLIIKLIITTKYFSFYFFHFFYIFCYFFIFREGFVSVRLLFSVEK